MRKSQDLLINCKLLFRAKGLFWSFVSNMSPSEIATFLVIYFVQVFPKHKRDQDPWQEESSEGKALLLAW